MPTVAMTGDLEQYVDSLRCYLSENPEVDKSATNAPKDGKAGGSHEGNRATSPKAVKTNYQPVKMAGVVSTQKH